MDRIVAIAGKGGTGKSTISALLIDWLIKNNKGSVLAVDADPNSNLANYLGLSQKETVGDIIDDIAKHPDKVPASMGKNQYIEYRIQTTLTESGGVDLLSMGRPEGPGCYCYANNALRGIIEKLINSYDSIIIDNEAGMEHLSRRTTRKADSVVIVSDFSAVGLRAAGRILELVKELELDVKNKFLIVNRAKKDLKLLRKEIDSLKIELIGVILEDKELLKLSVADKPVTALKNNSIILKEIDRIGSRLWQ